VPMSDWNEETADWYADKYGEYPTNRLGVALLELEPDVDILDVGCGTAAALREAATSVVSGRLVGVDPVARMLEIARERSNSHPEGHRIELVLGTADRLPVQDEGFDIVLAFDSMDHWPDRDAGLREIVRVLKPLGRLVVVKDGDIPGSPRARSEITSCCERQGLRELRFEDVREGDVRFAFWIFSKPAS